jgi:hypothetical protein
VPKETIKELELVTWSKDLEGDNQRILNTVLDRTRSTMKKL